MEFKDILRRLPGLGPTIVAWHRLMRSGGKQLESEGFRTSGQYWERRYALGLHSGDGSYGRFAKFKAEVVNSFIEEHHVFSVVEFGCGDGNQLKLLRIAQYSGFDVSETAVRHCRKVFKRDPTKEFRVLEEYRSEQSDLALSLDVVYHLVEDQIFEQYMRTLFGAARSFVVIYSSNAVPEQASHAHVRHRKITDWIRSNLPQWKLIKHVPNRYPPNENDEGSFADFFIYARIDERIDRPEYTLSQSDMHR